MKRLSLLSLVAVLVFGLLSVGAFAAEAEDSDTTRVYWYFSGQKVCAVSIDAHSNVDLGDATFQDVGGKLQKEHNIVHTEGNCPYEVTVKAIDSHVPTGAGNLYDTNSGFRLRLDPGQSGGTTISSWGNLNSWRYFNGNLNGASFNSYKLGESNWIV